MEDWENAPIVTLARGGEELTLGRDGSGPTVHLTGSTGLGLAPVEVASSPRLGGDGSIARGVRFEDREVFIPLHVQQPTMRELHEWRRALTRLIAPVPGDPTGSLVDVRIEDPTTGTIRTARGIYRDGLTGDFGADYRGHWQTIGLTFDCPDPWWLGPEQTVELRVNPGSKPFLSDTVPFFPVVLAQSTVQGQFDVTIAGDGPVWPAWEVVGPGTDLVIARASDRIKILGDFPAGSPVLIDTAAGRITPDRWDDTTLESVLFPLEAGRQTITVTLVGATTDTLVRLTYRERYLEGI